MPTQTKENPPARLAYSMQEFADLYGVSDRTVYTWIKSGKLRAFKIGRLVRIPHTAIAEMMEGAK